MIQRNKQVRDETAQAVNQSSENNPVASSSGVRRVPVEIQQKSSEIEVEPGK